MEDFAVSDILKATKGHLVRGNPETVVSGVSTDSRTLKKNDLFVALIGERFDGHNFIAQAIARGASGVLVSRDIEVPPAKFLIKVKDTLKALGDMAGAYRRNFNTPIVGITGSNGKTSTKDMTAAVLSQKYSILKSEGNFNNAIGVPMTLFGLSRTYRAAVIEMGTGAPGEMSRLVEIAQPNIGVINNVGPTHLEFFGSIDEVAAEKSVLARSVKLAVLNADDHRVSEMRASVDGTVVSFGLAEADVQATEIRQDRDGKLIFTLAANGEMIEICLSALGKHNVYNALAAASVGLLFRMKLDEIKKGLESYRGVPKRMQEMAVNGAMIIDDTYNSNPVSLKAALDFLSAAECDGKKIVVVGDMLELGGKSDELHREMGRYIAGCPIHTLMTVGDRAEKMAEAALDSGIPENRAAICKTNPEALEHLRLILNDGDLALIKGSRGMKMEEIVEALKEGSSR
jgi:UDP-N-acetylmuramoyl-tripeptide--D-alanyl-D-alanine ligase